jgi:D-threo-aldose 1-dehydrogenase
MYLLEQKQRLGNTPLHVPPIIFGTSCLGNLYQQLPYGTKLEIVSEWFKYVKPPVAVDTAGKYGAGLALEIIGKTLRELGAKPEDVTISNKLGWKRVPLKGPEPMFEPGAWVGIDHDAEQAISYEGILECFEQGCELLGGRYAPQILSVHDPDEYLAAARDQNKREQRFEDILGAYEALHELKAAGKAKAIGVGAKDWKVIRELASEVELDWVMFACSLTVYTHPAELLAFMEELNNKNVGIINSAVFNSGFLTGGDYFNYRSQTPDQEPELFAWRRRFFTTCRRFGVEPAAACVRFALSTPGIVAVALNTSRPRRIKDNAESITADISPEFWASLRDEKLIADHYTYL